MLEYERNIICVFLFIQISKYYEEMKQAGLEANKHVYMSLIKAYASCGEFEKAKQVSMRIICSFKSSRVSCS